MKLSVSCVFDVEMMLRRQTGAPLYRLAYPCQIHKPHPVTDHVVSLKGDW